MVKKLGLKITQGMVGKSASRFLPIIGAVGVGAYAYYDTNQVAKTAIELFSKEIEQGSEVVDGVVDGVVDEVEIDEVMDAPVKRSRPRKS